MAVPVGSIAIVVAIVREPESVDDASDGFIHVGGEGAKTGHAMPSKWATHKRHNRPVCSLLTRPEGPVIY